MSDIPGLIMELNTISGEITNRNKELSKLKKRKKQIEDSLCKFFEEKKQPGVKYKGIAVITEETKERLRKKKSEKEEDCISLLKHYNVNNPEKLYRELVDQLKGDRVSKKKIKIQNINGV